MAVGVTLETATREVGLLLSQVTSRLQRRAVLELFAEMGTVFPPELLAQGGFTTELDAIVAAGDQLVTELDALSVAITEDDIPTLIAAGAAAIVQLGEVFDGIGDVASALRSINAAALPGISQAQLDALADDFPRKLLAHQLTSALRTYPIALNLLSLLGVVEVTRVPRTPTVDAHVRIGLDLATIPRLFTEPGAVFRELYGWGEASFDGEALFAKLRDAFEFVGIPVELVPASGGNPASLRAGALQLEVASGGLRFVTPGPVPSGLGISLPVLNGWALEFETLGSFPAGLEARIEPPFNVTVTPPSGPALGSGHLSIALVASAAEPFMVLGIAGSNGVSARSVRAEARINVRSQGGNLTIEPEATLTVPDGHVQIGGGEGDGLLSSILPKFSADFELGIGASPERGVFFRGGATLEVSISVSLELGPIKVHTIRIELTPSSDSVVLIPSLDFDVDFGPAQLAIKSLGVKADLGFEDGNLGPLDLDFGLKLPDGAGIAVDLGPAKGGGFLSYEPEQERYSGALQIEIANSFEIQVIGLIAKTSSGKLSILGLGSVQFTPPIQLFLGFGLGGIGLLVGIHRSMDADALRAGVRQGGLDSILFPQDLARNAVRVLDDLGKFFPPTQGSYVFGAMGLLTWGAGGLFELKLGIAIEVPDHVKLLVAAILDIRLPPGDGSILKMRADVLGLWEISTGEVTIDGTLFDSKVTGFLISGDSAFRNKSSRGFILSQGGFHPAFDPPCDLIALERLAIRFSTGGAINLRVEGYFALTSNTLQAGVRAELRASAAGFTLEGWIGLDMLFQFDPFRVLAEFSAGVRIRRGGSTLMSLTLNARLDGFTPTKIAGKVSFKILFIRIRIPVSLTFGKKSEKRLKTADVLAELVAALQDPRNWATDVDRAETQAVSLREATPLPAGGDLLVHPRAPLSVQQQTVPLRTEIDLFKSAKPVREREFYITEITARDEPLDLADTVILESDFAPAQYFDYKDDEKLSAPSFEKMPAGTRASFSGFDFGSDLPTSRNMQYETEVWDRLDDEWRRDQERKRYQVFQQIMLALAILSAIAQRQRELNPERFVLPADAQRITLAPQRYVVAERHNGALQQVSALTAEPTSHAQASAALRKYQRLNPFVTALAPDRYRVVGAHELS